jgi:hypothetical protein
MGRFGLFFLIFNLNIYKNLYSYKYQICSLIVVYVLQVLFLLSNRWTFTKEREEKNMYVRKDFLFRSIKFFLCILSNSFWFINSPVYGC